MRSTIATDAADVVRAFYRDVLGGEEVCSTRADDAVVDPLGRRIELSAQNIEYSLSTAKSA